MNQNRLEANRPTEARRQKGRGSERQRGRAEKISRELTAAAGGSGAEQARRENGCVTEAAEGHGPRLRNAQGGQNGK